MTVMVNVDGDLPASRAPEGVRFVAGPVPYWAWRRGNAFAAFTTRDGGLSTGEFESLNLGLDIGDQPAAVAANRDRVCAALGIEHSRVRSALQVHGSGVWVDDGLALGVGWDDAVPTVEADALVTQRDRGHAVVVHVADCVPVVIAGAAQIAVVHAGWRGVVAGVLERAMMAIGETVQRAVVGPAIGPCCYEVGNVVAGRLSNEVVYPSARPGANPHVDLPLEVELRLRGLGVVVDRIYACTSCDPRLFSHRRDAGATGRQAALAWFG